MRRLIPIMFSIALAVVLLLMTAPDSQASGPYHNNGNSYRGNKLLWTQLLQSWESLPES